MARALMLRQADDNARALWAMAVETARVADRLNVDASREGPDSIRIGSRVIPVNADRRNVVIGAQTADTRVDTLRAASLTLDYVGPSGLSRRKPTASAMCLTGV